MASGISFQLVGDVGDDLGTNGTSSYKFRGTVEAVDETNTKCLYAIPFRSSKIVKYNPSTDETTRIDFETNSETTSNHRHFDGGVVARDNKIYMSPCYARRILMLDPKTNTATYIGQDLGTNGVKYTGAVCNEDGSEVYFTPVSATKILKLDIGTQTTSFVGGDLGNGYKWMGGGAVLNGNIYFAPCNATQVLQFNISTGKTCRVGDKYDGNNKWSGAVSCNGKDVYFIPYKHHQILKLDTETMQTQLVGSSFGDRQIKFYGGVQLSNETICMIPYGVDQITLFNPSNEQINRNGDFNGYDKSWACPVLTSNGTIYAAPSDASQFMHVKVDTFVDSLPDTPQSTFSKPECLDTLGETRKSKFIGQHHLITALKEMLGEEEDEIKKFTGSTTPRTIMLNGPPGCGKTELAGLIAEIIHGEENKQLENNGKYKVFNMGQFKSKENVNCFFGAAPGYEGGDGELVSTLKNCSTAVIVLDEIEKAHKSVRDDALLSISNGAITSNKGETVSTTDATFIFTSNLKVTDKNHVDKNGKVDIEKVSSFINGENCFSGPMISRLKGNVLQFETSTQIDKEHLVRMILTRIRDGFQKKKMKKGIVKLSWDYSVIVALVSSKERDHRHLKKETEDELNNLVFRNEEFKRLRKSRGGVKVHLSSSNNKEIDVCFSDLEMNDGTTVSHTFNHSVDEDSTNNCEQTRSGGIKKHTIETGGMREDSAGDVGDADADGGDCTKERDVDVGDAEDIGVGGAEDTPDGNFEGLNAKKNA